MKIKKNDIINLMVICLPLCPYKIFSIGDKDISAIYMVWGLLVIMGFLDVTNFRRSFKKNGIVLLTIVYFLINSLVLSNRNVGSIVQFVLLWTILFLSYRQVTYSEYQRTINLFHKVMNIMAVYGIYEFVGRFFHLPLSDLWIPGHMVEGYNWYNTEVIGGVVISRANGVFVEPSMFSQYLAINILLYLFASEVQNRKRTLKILISAVALVCTLSGTGIILLILGTLFFFFSRGGAKAILNIVRKNKIWVILFAIAFLSIIISPIGKYMISRLSEFNPTNTKSISGYIRFVGQFNIAFAVIKDNPFWGIGIGNVQEFINVYRMSGGATAFASIACSMIAARYAAELGIIGLVLLFFYYKSFFKKDRFKNLNYRILLICVLIMIPLCDSGISVNYWFLLYLLNVDFKGERARVM